MPETIKITGGVSPELELAYYALLQLGEKKANDVISETPDLEVCLTVNGNEVSYSQVVKTLYNEFESLVNQRAAQMVLDKIELDSYTPIQRINQIYEAANWEAKSLVRKVFNVTLPDDDND